MINGMHAILYTQAADEVRKFFQKTLKFPHVDAGRGWLIFALPPSEMGVHPVDKPDRASYEMYLMCDDIENTVSELKTAIELPGGLEMGLYEPRHPTAIGTGTKKKKAAARTTPKKRKTVAKKKPRKR